MMEGSRDAAILPLTEFSPISGTVDAIAGNDSSWTSRKRRGQHIDGERVRRETMSQNFSVLQSLVPNLLPRATREKIVTDTIQYIQRLEREIERLESLKKLQSPEPLAAWPIFTGFSSSKRPSVDVTICDGGGGGVVFFGIKSAARRNLAAEILAVFEKHEAKVLGATVSVEDGQQRRWLGLTVTALVGGDGDKAERIKGDILNL